MTLLITGHSLTLEQVDQISKGATIALSIKCREKVNASRKIVESAVKQKHSIYAINTGFGALANTKISEKDLIQLQHNILYSHASGWGKPLTEQQARLAQILRLNVLAKGHSGVRWILCQRIAQHITSGITPIIPEFGSVGASGDLVPLAHLALPLIGCGLVYYKGQILTAKKALKLTKIASLTLKEKEGISLVNGTQIMLATGSIALNKAIQLTQFADQCAALTMEAMNAHTDALHTKIHYLRNQPMQQESARLITQQLQGSSLWSSTIKRTRIQDPYSLRCTPQVHGATRSSLAFSASMIEKELNAVTDNPIVLPDEKIIVSGGNFHGQPLALSFDAAAMALSEIGNISERRLNLLLTPEFSGLPPFLASKHGTNSGLMATQYLAASLVNHNKILANPSSTDSIPGNLGVEDHVSMGATSAKKLQKITENTAAILAVELIAAAEAIDKRKRKKLGKGTKKLHSALRKIVLPLHKDRILSEDIQTVTNFINEM